MSDLVKTPKTRTSRERKQNTYKCGQAAVLTDEQIDELLDERFLDDRERTLAAICLFTGARIAETCALFCVDVYDGNRVREWLTLRKNSTKGKQVSRVIPVHPRLAEMLLSYRHLAGDEYMFPGRFGQGTLKPTSASRCLRKAFDALGLDTASTHSFRRTALTRMHREKVPLNTICKISGHKSLAVLQEYLEVSEEEKVKAISTLWSDKSR